MTQKGISQTLWIVVAIVVILVVAIVILTVFSGGIQNFLAIFNPWSSTTAGIAACNSACASLCAANPNLQGQPPGWADTYNRLGCSNFPSITCICSEIGFGTPLGGGPTGPTATPGGQPAPGG